MEQTPRVAKESSRRASRFFLQRTSRQIAGRPTRSRAEFDGWSVPLQGGKRLDVLVLSLYYLRSRYSGLLFGWRSRAGDSYTLPNLIRFSLSVCLDTPVPCCSLPSVWTLAHNATLLLADHHARPELGAFIFWPTRRRNRSPIATYTPQHAAYTLAATPGDRAAWEPPNEVTLPVVMKSLRRIIHRIRGEGLESSASLTNALPVVQTSEVTILATPSETLNNELKGWADEPGVMLEPADGVWWRYGDLDGALALVRDGKGLAGLQFHGGRYAIGSAKDVLSGGPRQSPMLL